jgi:hypothetical protein
MDKDLAALRSDIRALAALAASNLGNDFCQMKLGAQECGRPAIYETFDCEWRMCSDCACSSFEATPDDFVSLEKDCIKSRRHLSNGTTVYRIKARRRYELSKARVKALLALESRWPSVRNLLGQTPQVAALSAPRRRLK